MKVKTLVLALSLLLLGGLAQAQAPASLPGFQVQGFVGYTGFQGQSSGNGMFTSFEVPVYTLNAKWSATVSARLDNFQLSNPNTNVLLGGPEFRFQFSSSTFIDGQVFQPFINIMGGASRNACVAQANCAAGVSTVTSPAWKVGGGLDMVTSSHTTWRLLEVDRIQLTSGPVVVGNTNQFITGFGFKF